MESQESQGIAALRFLAKTAKTAEWCLFGVY